jgi:hypothetical protein
MLFQLFFAGQIQQVSVVIPDAVRARGFIHGVVSIFFTTQTTLLLQAAPQNFVTLSFPADFFGNLATAPKINSQSPASSFINPLFNTADGNVNIVLQVNERRLPTTFNVTLDHVTMGSPDSLSTCISNVFVRSSTDRRSTNPVSAGVFNSLHVSRSSHILHQAVSGAKYGTWR